MRIELIFAIMLATIYPTRLLLLNTVSPDVVTPQHPAASCCQRKTEWDNLVFRLTGV